MNITPPAFEQLSLDKQQFHIDIHAAWQAIQDSYAKLKQRYDEGLMSSVFAQWSQLEEHLISNGMQAVYGHFLQDFQHEINLTLLKSHDEFSIDLMRIITELNLVNPTMLLDFSRRGFDCIEVEQAALATVLGNKQYLIKTHRKDEIHSLTMLMELYAQEPRPEFVKMILDEVSTHLTNQSVLHNFCLSIPLEHYKKDLKGVYAQWLNNNQELLIKKLSDFKSPQLSDTHVFYALKVGARDLASALYPNIGKLNDYRTAVKLKNAFGQPLADFAWNQFRSESPRQAMAYIMSCPDEFSGTDLAQPRFDCITLTEHLPEAMQLLRRHKAVIDHDHVSGLIDNSSAELNAQKLIQKLKPFELVDNDFRITSRRLKRVNLENEFSL